MDNNQNHNKNKKNDKRGWLLVLITTLITGYLLFSLFSMAGKATTQEISYDEFLKMVDEGRVEEVIIGNDKLTIIPKANASGNEWQQLFPGVKITYYTGVVKDEALTERLYEEDVKFGSEIPDTASALFWNIILTIVLPFVLIFAFMSFMMKKMSKGGGIMGIGKSNAKMYVEKETGVTFKDVAGQDEAKESLQEVVDFLHNPKKYTEVGLSLIHI